MREDFKRIRAKVKQPLKGFSFLCVCCVWVAIVFLVICYYYPYYRGLASFCVLILFFVSLERLYAMQSNVKCKVFSLNVRGMREQTKRRSIFSYLKDQKADFYFLQETYSDANDESMWQCERGGKILFSHGTHHSKGVCILLDPTANSNVEYLFSNNTGRIVLISTYLNGVKTSLCNIYAPNNQSDQLEFIQELKNCIVDKSEMTNIIIGGDWNCTLTKKDKKGGAFWKPTPFRNLLLTTMETFDLIDIYRARHPNLQLFFIRILIPTGQVENRLFSRGKIFGKVCKQSWNYRVDCTWS